MTLWNKRSSPFTTDKPLHPPQAMVRTMTKVVTIAAKRQGNKEHEGGANQIMTRQRARGMQNATSENLSSLTRTRELLSATAENTSPLARAREIQNAISENINSLTREIQNATIEGSNPLDRPEGTPETSRQPDSTAVQMPLRALPIPPLQPDGPPRMVYTHQPFYTADLVTWSNQMPSLRDDPDKCHRQVSAIFSTHKPTWPDVHVLLNALFNEAEKADILTKAGEAIELPNYQTGRPAGVEALTAQCLRTEPTWDYNTTNGIWCLNLFKRAILDGIKAAGQRTVNWTKVQTVLQGANEHPSDYYTRLVSAIKTWGGIDPENSQHEVIVKGFFKDQACPDIRKALNLQIGYDGKSISEILSIAKSVYNSRDERKKRDPKPEVEQVLALSMELNSNRGRSFTRGKGTRGGGPSNPHRPWGPTTSGCFYCQEEGHIRRFCPYLNNTVYATPHPNATHGYGNPPPVAYNPQTAPAPYKPPPPPNAPTQTQRPLPGPRTQMPAITPSTHPWTNATAPPLHPPNQPPPDDQDNY